MDSSGAYDAIPLTSALDVKSKDRTDGLQYRAGLHYVRFSHHVRLVSRFPESNAAGAWRSRLPLRVSTLVYVQGRHVD